MYWTVDGKPEYGLLIDKKGKKRKKALQFHTISIHILLKCYFTIVGE